MASAKAMAVGAAPTVTIVASGRNGTFPLFEDDATAVLIDDLIGGHGEPGRVAAQVRESDSVIMMGKSSWAHRDDVRLATDADTFSFAMTCRLMPDGTATLAAIDP